jgi:hypothetical protein
MNELRKNVWNEAVRSAIKAYANLHPDIGLPYELQCFGTHAINPLDEGKAFHTVPRFFNPHLEITADEHGEPTWNMDAIDAYPNDFHGGAVRFLLESSRLTICEGVVVGLKFPDTVTEAVLKRRPHQKEILKAVVAATKNKKK